MEYIKLVKIKKIYFIVVEKLDKQKNILLKNRLKRFWK